MNQRACLFGAVLMMSCAALQMPAFGATQVLSLDGQWLLAVDAGNVGQSEKWWTAPRPEAKPTKVPWIIQDAFPGYHGVAWYWKEFEGPTNPHKEGRTLLRFWQVDYKCDVWLNDTVVGSHEGGESVFVFDVTGIVKPGQKNRLAVRVLNPTHQPIDGIVLNETPHRNKALPYQSGSAWNQGGIWDTVELLSVPQAWVEDLFVRPDWKTGEIRVQANIRNAGPNPLASQLQLSVAPAATGETVTVAGLEPELKVGDTLVEKILKVDQHRLWDLDQPYLYRVTATLGLAGVGDGGASHEQSVRCGFRDFRLEDGYFRLNGKRIYVKCSHTGNCCPIGLEMPHDPDFLRRDLINQKMMRYNTLRFIAGVPKRYQLDLADEIGLMVYEEPYAAWCLADSPQMKQRYNESVLGMIRRDRNHPSVAIWGLLNETPDGPVFRHAVSVLPEVRKLDDTRLVLLNSGNWHADGGGTAGIRVWRNTERDDPCVTWNGTDHIIQALGITWQPGQIAFHPGRHGEYAVVRWTAPANEKVEFSAVFKSIAQRATTSVHVMHNGQPLFDSLINLESNGPECQYSASIDVNAGDTLDCACGWGNGDYGADTTALTIVVKNAAGKVWTADKDFAITQNPNSAWSYGLLKPGDRPDVKTFTLFPFGKTQQNVGSVSNPGSVVWEDVLSDQHPYRRVPHTADVIRTLRTIHGNGKPLFISECGIGSAIDLMRTVRWYEQVGKPEVEDAQLYRSWRDQYLADWQRYRLDEVFARPEDFFQQSIARMAGQRLLSVNAVRANPACVGHSITGTLDQGMTAEGIWTTFRELKPGTTDAIFDVWAPVALVPVRRAAKCLPQDAGQAGGGARERGCAAARRIPGPSAGRRAEPHAGLRQNNHRHGGRPQVQAGAADGPAGVCGGRDRRRAPRIVSFFGDVRTGSGGLRRRGAVLRRRDAGGDAEGRDRGRADEQRQGPVRLAHRSWHSTSSLHPRPADAPRGDPVFGQTHGRPCGDIQGPRPANCPGFHGRLPDHRHLRQGQRNDGLAAAEDQGQCEWHRAVAVSLG